MPIINPMPPEFQFPRNLGDLTDAQREDLHRRFTEHVSTTDQDTVETNPSMVIDTQDPESVRRAARRRAARPGRHGAARDLRPGIGRGSNVASSGDVLMENEQEESVLYDPMAGQLHEDEERNRSRGGGNWDPRLGYVVAEEDPQLLAGRISRSRNTLHALDPDEDVAINIEGRSMRTRRVDEDVIITIVDGESRLHDPWAEELRSRPRPRPRQVDDPCHWKTYAERDAEERFGDL